MIWFILIFAALEKKTMKKQASFSFLVASFLLIAIASATIATAEAGDTCVGSGATIGGTCTPLTNITSSNNFNTALGAEALSANTNGSGNTATGFETLQNNTTGFDNTASGYDALAIQHLRLCQYRQRSPSSVKQHHGHREYG